MAIAIFLCFVGFVLGLSFFLGKKAKSAGGYFAAGGQIHWAVNGIAFAGDYLSAASFLGICGMIATKGYDGFLYSIGYLAGWIVALFIVAEPMKRLGKYTFTDALDSKFNSKGIQLTAAISTLVVSIFYLIPQMVGAGVLVEPLLGLAHHWGVIMVGAIVIFITATAGMASTTYVQFMKGGLLIIFSTVLVYQVCDKGLGTRHTYGSMTMTADALSDPSCKLTGKIGTATNTKGVVTNTFAQVEKDGVKTWWDKKLGANGVITLTQAATKTSLGNDKFLINGVEAKEGQRLQISYITKIQGNSNLETTGAITPFQFISLMGDPETEIYRFSGKAATFKDGDGSVAAYLPIPTKGNLVMKPGLKFKTKGFWGKFNFLSLMLALFCGTAALPHILIRYYTVPSAAAARKSTIVAIAAIGFFYVLTLFLGLGAMANEVIDAASGNMSAPLLARAFGEVIFAVISAIAFATVLGTVSGLIVAASGAVAHDIMDRWADMKLSDSKKVMAGKLSAVVVGIIAIVLGIAFKGMNVSFLVGWAFAVAASANLPSILMLLFWKKTTSQGIVASICVGGVAALGIILTGPDMYVKYGMEVTDALHKITQPGLIAIPLSFLTLIVVSLATQKKEA